jgi:hypothetical protein
MDTTPNLALITKDLAVRFPGIMAPGAFKRVDNLINEAVTRGRIAALPLVHFPHFRLVENAQSVTHDGTDPATNHSAYFMLHLAYDITATHDNTTSPVGCIVTSAGYPI